MVKAAGTYSYHSAFQGLCKQYPNFSYGDNSLKGMWLLRYFCREMKLQHGDSNKYSDAIFINDELLQIYVRNLHSDIRWIRNRPLVLKWSLSQNTSTVSV
jgi:hypothetical protein